MAAPGEGRPPSAPPLPSSSLSLFAALGLSPAGPLDDATLRRAFTAAARRSHPDKQRQPQGEGGEGGGGGEGGHIGQQHSFSTVRAAYETLLPSAGRARHASAARSEAAATGGGGGGASGGGPRAQPAEVDLDDFQWEGGGEADSEGAPADGAPLPPSGPAFWLACRCGGRHTVPEADLESAARRGRGGGGHAAPAPASILVPCDGCSLVVRAHFCAVGGGDGGGTAEDGQQQGAG